jgi:hypothetical protein
MDVFKEPTYFTGMKFKLSDDLTKYYPTLIKGAEGKILSCYSKLGDRFCTAQFNKDSIIIDLLYDTLIPIKDEQYLKELNEYKTGKARQLDTAYDIFYITGPRGGFKYLSYQYKGNNGVSYSTTNHDKTSGLEELAYFKKIGKQVITDIQ